MKDPDAGYPGLQIAVPIRPREMLSLCANLRSLPCQGNLLPCLPRPQPGRLILLTQSLVSLACQMRGFEFETMESHLAASAHNSS